MKRLIRSNEKIIAGVLGGVSNYVNSRLDPIFVRIAFLVITFYIPALILIYAGLALILPREKSEFQSEVLS